MHLVVDVTTDDMRLETLVQGSPRDVDVEMHAMCYVEEHAAIVGFTNLGFHSSVQIEDAAGIIGERMDENVPLVE